MNLGKIEIKICMSRSLTSKVQNDYLKIQYFGVQVRNRVRQPNENLTKPNEFFGVPKSHKNRYSKYTSPIHFYAKVGICT